MWEPPSQVLGAFWGTVRRPVVFGTDGVPCGSERVRFGYNADRVCYRDIRCTAAETMNQAPNILIQLGEALGPRGAFVVLLLLCTGAVWVVMAIRSNKNDHARVEAMIESLRKETREESKGTRQNNVLFFIWIMTFSGPSRYGIAGPACPSYPFSISH